MSVQIRATLVVSLLAAATVLLLSPGHADRGVGISLTEMTVETVLSPGNGYVLPAVSVMNTGTEPSDYEVSIGYVADQPQQQPEAGWFRFEPQRFTLQPGDARDVQGRLVLPADARAGDYFALLKAQTVSSSQGGTSVGIAAAAKVSFTVESSSWLEVQASRINHFLGDNAPWTFLLPAGLLLGFAAMKYGRMRFRLRSPFERR